MPGDTTRDQILQAAQDLFTTKGYANASVSDICRQAGVSPPTLYYHFGNKGGLFDAVVEEALSLDAFQALLSEAIAAQPDVWGKLQASVHTYLAHFPSEFLNPGLHLRGTTQLAGTSLNRLQVALSDIYELTQDLLQEGIAVGEFREVDVETTALCLIGTVDSFVRSQAYLGSQYDLEDVTSAIVDLFANGLRSG